MKRHVTLIEVMIAMALVSVLMTVLMGYYGQISMLHSEVEAARQESFLLRYLQARLSYVLPAILPVKSPKAEKEKANDFYFFTSEDQDGGIQAPSLVFTYDNGVDIDATFSNGVLGRLALENRDGKGRLVLLTWPLPRYKGEMPPPMKKEILIDKVTSLSFSFFNPLEADTESKTKDLPQPVQDETPKADQNVWLPSWKLAYNDLPAIIKVTVTRSIETGLIPPDQPITMAFPIPNSKKTIIMRQ